MFLTTRSVRICHTNNIRSGYKVRPLYSLRKFPLSAEIPVHEFAIKKTYLNDFSVATSKVIAILIILKGSVD